MQRAKLLTAPKRFAGECIRTDHARGDANARKDIGLPLKFTDAAWLMRERPNAAALAFHIDRLLLRERLYEPHRIDERAVKGQCLAFAVDAFEFPGTQERRADTAKSAVTP